MNLHDLRIAQLRFENRIEEIISSREDLYRFRAEFVRYFHRNRILNMRINDYVIGVDLPNSGFNFCYAVERQLDGLGRIIGANAFKFGVYYGITKSDKEYKYRFTKKFGETYQVAFTGIKQALLELLDAGEHEDIQEIVSNPISAMFKGKILSTYFPERYLNIFSGDHLDYYLTQLDLDTEELIEDDPVLKREALISFKNLDPVMKHWPVDLFAYFLYTEYPGRPPKGDDTKEDETTNPLSSYRMPKFPVNPIAGFINLNIIPPISSRGLEQGNGDRKKRKNPDYEQEARKLKKLGDRGEKIVKDLESERLKAAGRHDLVKKIKRISRESDSYGYDILSFETNGNERYIEVKATRSKVGPANFFLTANELKTAIREENYFIYMVYDIMSKYPKVWSIINPFNPENKNLVKTPVNYRVIINVTKP